MSKVVSIFGSSHPVEGHADYRVAYEIGAELGRSGFKICNGGYSGIMAASSRGAKEAGASTIGITTDFYKSRANPWIDKEIKLPTPMDRLLMLVELGEAYVVLKGGTGTLLELACVWEFINKNVVKEKPIVVFGDFWTPLIGTLRKQGLEEGIGDVTRFVLRVDSPQECARVLLEKLAPLSGKPLPGR
jgi:hypothetical protein